MYGDSVSSFSVNPPSTNSGYSGFNPYQASSGTMTSNASTAPSTTQEQIIQKKEADKRAADAKKKQEASDKTTDTNGAGQGAGQVTADMISAAIKAILGVDPEKMWKKEEQKAKEMPKPQDGDGNDQLQKLKQALGLDAKYQRQWNTLASLATPQALYGVGGMPSMYLYNTDPPSELNAMGVGGTYLSHNVNNGQFIVFKPGYIKWDVSASKIKEIISDPSAAVSTVAKLFTGSLSYHHNQLDQYWIDVSRACRIAIHYMSLHDATFPFAISSNGFSKKKNKKKSKLDIVGNNMKPIDGTKWYKMGEMQADAWKTIGIAFANAIANKGEITMTMDTDDNGQGDYGVVPFFVNGNIEATSSMNNSVGDNPFKEIVSAVFGDSSEAMRMVIGQAGLQGSNFGNSVLAFFTGNPLMPQVWQSSQFDKSYNVNLKFNTHSPNPISSFTDCIYPMIKFMLLALPLGIGGYQTSPPVVKVFSQGSINTEYGMITSININRNIDTYSASGYPSDIDISASIVDMNPYLYKERPGWFNKSVETSTGFSNFIATTLGRNITTIPVKERRKIDEVLKKVDALEQGRWTMTNIKFGFFNFYNSIMGGFEDFGHNFKMTFGETTGRISGIFGGRPSASKLYGETQTTYGSGIKYTGMNYNK